MSDRGPGPVAVLGEALIDLIEAPDGVFRPHRGGSPYNLAIGLARQGVDVSWLSPLSVDAFGDDLAASLNAERIGLAIARRSRYPTALALVRLDAQGIPDFQLYREGVADSDIGLEEIIAALPPATRLLHTGSLAITPDRLPLMRALFAHLHERGIRISVDLNMRLHVVDDRAAYRAGVRSLLPYCHIIKASDEDLAALEPEGDPFLIAGRIRAMQPASLLIFTRGAAGAELFYREIHLRQAAFPVAQLGDAIGAGDTFHAAFLAAVLAANPTGQLLEQPAPLAAALERACAAAALNVMRRGCVPPTCAEVDQFLRHAR